MDSGGISVKPLLPSLIWYKYVWSASTVIDLKGFHEGFEADASDLELSSVHAKMTQRPDLPKTLFDFPDKLSRVLVVQRQT